MATVSSPMKVDIVKFDGNISFRLWQVYMRDFLTQQVLKKDIIGKPVKPMEISDIYLEAKKDTTMCDLRWETMDDIKPYWQSSCVSVFDKVRHQQIETQKISFIPCM